MPPANIAGMGSGDALKQALAQAQGLAPGGQQMPGVDPMAAAPAGDPMVAELMARMDRLEGALIDNGYLDAQDVAVMPESPAAGPQGPPPPDPAASQAPGPDQVGGAAPPVPPPY